MSAMVKYISHHYSTWRAEALFYIDRPGVALLSRDMGSEGEKHVDI